MAKEQEQATEVDVASGVDIEILMTSYVEDNTSQGKNWIFEQFMYVPRMSYSITLWLQKRKRLSKWWMAQIARLRTGTIKVTERDGTVRALEVNPQKVLCH